MLIIYRYGFFGMEEEWITKKNIDSRSKPGWESWKKYDENNNETGGSWCEN